MGISYSGPSFPTPPHCSTSCGDGLDTKILNFPLPLPISTTSNSPEPLTVHVPGGRQGVTPGHPSVPPALPANAGVTEAAIIDTTRSTPMTTERLATRG